MLSALKRSTRSVLPSFGRVTTSNVPSKLHVNLNGGCPGFLVMESCGSRNRMLTTSLMFSFFLPWHLPRFTIFSPNYKSLLKFREDTAHGTFRCKEAKATIHWL